MANLTTVLERLNAQYENITNIVGDDLFMFSDEDISNGKKDDYISHRIQDGGIDMYDDGNHLSTNRLTSYEDGKDGDIDDYVFDEGDVLVGVIGWTHTALSIEGPDDLATYDDQYTDPPADGEIVDGEAAFGSGSEYFTNMYPGLFVLGSQGIDINEFSILGDIGADGGGEVEVNSYSYGGYVAYLKSVYDTSDPSINQIIITNGSGLTQLYDENSQYDDHSIQGSIGDELYYLLVSRKVDEEDSDALGNSAFQDIVEYFVINILGVEEEESSIYPSYTFEVVTDNSVVATDSSSPYKETQHYEHLKKQRTVFIKGIDRRLKHGDRITVNGQMAVYIRKIHVDVSLPTLKIIEGPQ